MLKLLETIASPNQDATRLAAPPVMIVGQTPFDLKPTSDPQGISKLNASSKKPTPKHPYPHQKIAIENILKGFSNPDKPSDRGKIIMPCGSGKTLTAMWAAKEIIKEADNKTILVTVPSLALLKQIKNDWRENFGEKFKYLCVCSDNDVDADEKDKKEQDTFIHERKNVSKFVTNDPIVIKKFLKSSPAKTKVVFSTYQSSDKIEEAMKSNPKLKFKIGIADESHRTTGKKDPDKNNPFHIFHDNNRIRCEKRLYATATPRCVYGSEKQEVKNAEHLYEMSDERTYGPTFHEMNFGEAIKQGLISDYEIVVVGINPQVIEGKTRVNPDPLSYNKALEAVIKEYGLQKIISFHSRVKDAQKFQKDHSSIANASAQCLHINGESKDKDTIMKKFASSSLPTIITNARCLTEGVDVPAVDAVYFRRRKNSTIDIAQAIGRALRLGAKNSKGIPLKQKARIIIPVLKPLNGSLDDLENDDFKNLINVIQALRYQDERVAEYFWHNPENETGSGKRPGVGSLPIKCINIDDGFVLSVLEKKRPEIYGSWVNSFAHVKEAIQIHHLPRPSPKIKADGTKETQSEANIRFFQSGGLKSIFGFGWARLKTLAKAAWLGELTYEKMVNELWGAESFKELITKIRTEQPTRPSNIRAFFDHLASLIGIGTIDLVQDRLMKTPEDPEIEKLQTLIKPLIENKKKDKVFYTPLADFIWKNAA